MKIVSWNVNGIRAVQKSGFLDWFDAAGADVVCLQETKAQPDQLTEEVLHPKKYHSFWHSAEKKGYSGVAVYSKKEPREIITGIGADEFDREGRVLGLDFGSALVFSAYFPNSQRDHARLGYKLKFCEKILGFLQKQVKRGKNIVLCGDYNIAHQEIDLKNPKTNTKNPGFLPEERAWMSHFLENGFVDGFRHFEPSGGHYTWWSYRPGVREKNIGWRIDYACVNAEFKDRMKSVRHYPDVFGSDHCPVEIVLKR